MNWNERFFQLPRLFSATQLSSGAQIFQVPQSTFTHIRNDGDADDDDGQWLILTFGTANRCRIRGRAAYLSEPAY